MPIPLYIDKKLQVATQLILRARIFYDIWRYFEGAETRPSIIETMRSYSEYFRFEPHAHFVAFVVHIAALYEKRNDTVNLRRLVKEYNAASLIPAHDLAEIDALLAQANPLISKVTILRNNLFAHRNATLSYKDAFTKAAVTPDQLCTLTDIALKIANRLLVVRGHNECVFNPLPLKDVAAMLKALE